MKKKLIVANWKANPESIREAKEILSSIKRALKNLPNVEAIICPPAVFLAELTRKTKGNPRLEFGAQNAFWELNGAFTGQLGPTMLRNSGAKYLILGHSEARRAGDSDSMINRKIKLALTHGLKVILCVGEEERDEAGQYLQTIRTQLEENLRGVLKKQFANLVIAYEPIWAIGLNARAVDTPRGFLEQAIYIRKVISAFVGKDAALVLPILYGGSVKAENALSFLVEGEASGLLVGRASLEPENFIQILKSADEFVKNH